MNTPFFSLIVPVYNIECYITECVESLIKQDIEDYEILLIDDGSTDGSPDLCDSFASIYSNIKVIHKKNKGLSSARNEGIIHARGKYILFVDGDDYITNNILGALKKEIILNKYPSLICLECCKFFENNSKKIMMNDGIDETINNLDEKKLKLYFSNLPKFPGSACTKSISREFIVNNSLYFIEGMLCEDLYWSIRLFTLIDKAIYFNTQYYFYRQGRIGSITNNSSIKKTMDILFTIELCDEIINSSTYKENKIMICNFMGYLLRF